MLDLPLKMSFSVNAAIATKTKIAAHVPALLRKVPINAIV
jgi:hypothetical protein